MSKQKKARKSKRRTHEVVYLRVPPALHAVISEHVRGMNRSRRPGDAAMTMQAFALRCMERELAL